MVSYWHYSNTLVQFATLFVHKLRSVTGRPTAAMSLSTELIFGGQSNRGDTICVVPDLSSDLTEDDLNLNKSYPCTQKSSYKKNLLALQLRYYPSSFKGRY